MNFSIILYIIGYVLRIEGILMLLPAGVGLFYGERQAYAFFICAAVSLAVGFLCSLKRPKIRCFTPKRALWLCLPRGLLPAWPGAPRLS